MFLLPGIFILAIQGVERLLSLDTSMGTPRQVNSCLRFLRFRSCTWHHFRMNFGVPIFHRRSNVHALIQCITQLIRREIFQPWWLNRPTQTSLNVAKIFLERSPFLLGYTCVQSNRFSSGLHPVLNHHVVEDRLPRLSSRSNCTDESSLGIWRNGFKLGWLFDWLVEHWNLTLSLRVNFCLRYGFIF